MTFISQAFAQTTEMATDAAATGSVTPGILGQLMPLVLIFAVFYILLIRPQQKKLKAHIDMVAALRRGDKVVTGGGIIGTIQKIVDDKEVVVSIADGVEIRVLRGSISEVVSKTPVSAAGNSEAA
jgi:preprotein translocase subunit YajC